VDLDADGGRHLVRCHRASRCTVELSTGPDWSARESEKGEDGPPSRPVKSGEIDRAIA
jgi:hypothetical protein